MKKKSSKINDNHKIDDSDIDLNEDIPEEFKNYSRENLKELSRNGLFNYSSYY